MAKEMGDQHLCFLIRHAGIYYLLSSHYKPAKLLPASILLTHSINHFEFTRVDQTVDGFPLLLIRRAPQSNQRLALTVGLDLKCCTARVEPSGFVFGLIWGPDWAVVSVALENLRLALGISHLVSQAEAQKFVSEHPVP